MAKGLPLIPKFYGPGGPTGLTAKEALGGGLGVVSVTPPVAPPVVVPKAPKMPKGAPVYLTPPVAPLAPNPLNLALLTLAGAPGTLKVALPTSLHVRLRTLPEGKGGWQSIMQGLYDVTDPDVPVCYLTLGHFLALVAKSIKHGQGGYQGVLRHVVCLAVAQNKGVMDV